MGYFGGRVKNYFICGLSTIVIILAGILILSFSDNKEEKPGFYAQFNKDYKIYSLKLPDTLYFAGEKVPMENFDVRESLDRELLVNAYWQSHTILYIKRANRYFPRIEKVLEKHNIPEDFKYIPLIESDMTNAVSPAGATGFWQLMKGTATDHGLEVNKEVDERYNLEKATTAACEYFEEAYEKFGSWTLAAASFNVGKSALAKQINIQDADSYYNLLSNTETGKYVYRILAIKLILENPEKYGFHVDEEDLYYPVPTREVELDSSVKDFSEYAKEFGLNYKMFKYFNPWLREPSLHNSENKTYKITIPEDDSYRDYQNNIRNQHKED
ncbi:MAG: lytic transglycosylase domain-containing protein [Bacteroidota bacterium]